MQHSLPKRADFRQIPADPEEVPAGWVILPAGFPAEAMPSRR
jgi:hypothetical protein